MKSTDTRPVISIVMPCFNAAGYLPTSVASVIAQTLPDWELIVVDDGSTDHSSDWLRSQRDPRIRVIQQTNQGVGSARNAGLACAQAHYVAFLDADDAWAPHFLETMLAALKAQPHAVLAYCGWQNLGLIGGRGQPFIPPEYETPHKHETLFANCRWPIHAAMTLRSKVLEVGGFSHTLKNAEDYALWLEVAAQAPIVRVPEVLAYYHFHSGEQASSNKLRAALQLLNAQKSYLRKHPDFFCNMGRTHTRKLLYGNLLRAGFDSYWKRDLKTARAIFRRTMFAGYGSPKDWIYMLPALLPISIHRKLINFLSGNNQNTPQDL